MEMIKAGPIGDTVSTTDTHWDEKGNTKISHIFVSFNSLIIISIQFGYIENGALVMSAKYTVVKLKHNEYVSGVVSGISSFIFYTNLGKHGPFCEFPIYSSSTSIKKEIDLATCDRREFGGFFGSSDGRSLKSIGIYVSPTPSSDTVVKQENV